MSAPGRAGRLRPAFPSVVAKGLIGLAAGLLVCLLVGPQALAQTPPGGQGGFGKLEPIEPPPTPAATPAPATPGSDASGTAAARRPPAVGPQVLIVLGVGVVVIVATLLVVLAVVLKPPVVINVVSRSAGGGMDGPPPADWIEGDLVRMGRPPEGTLKILPGRFVIDGDGTVFRIFRTSGADRVETTIGREQGPAYRHIQLKPLSVSAKHAKLVYENGFYSIVNYSRTNPTRVNGEDLPEGASRRLVDEDRLEVGEVAMTYHEI